eukprot:TRINITY_DN16846_c0_g1_i1.p1 TRINITY_DN16846_c0_g1~~TRINITY_DN16846_c0_g1_i1.p1  ORF type:complete len:577 (+),score=87.84 TRINITY_DN16846_c0_g1_i1:49-1731(+)
MNSAQRRSLVFAVVSLGILALLQMQFLVEPVERDRDQDTPLPAVVLSERQSDEKEVVTKTPEPQQKVKPKRQSGTNSIQLPYTYPVHQQIVSREKLYEGVQKQVEKQVRTCADHTTEPLLPAPSEYKRKHPKTSHTSLLNDFYIGDESKLVHSKDGLFLSGTSKPNIKDVSDIYWIPEDTDNSQINLPCTREAQLGLFKSQNPSDCASANFLATRLKADAHGLGSALSLVVHDLISSVLLGRIVTVKSNKWFFAPSECGSNGWTCYFTTPSYCPDPQEKGDILSSKTSKARVVRKKDTDQKGVSRSDLPELSTILDAKCVDIVNKWSKQPENTYLMGTFKKGSDPLLTWWMAQAIRYLVRTPQPWFSDAISSNLAGQGFPWKDGLVFQQLRGEIAKFREYYNTFGCHDVHITAYQKWTNTIYNNQHGKSDQPTSIYISGNTPHDSFLSLVSMQRADHQIYSTWNHSAAAVSSESKRWGANTLVVSWVDFWAGVASSGWVCIIQSNWCRMINFLRLTAGRANCPFIDLGVTMLSDPDERQQYCIVKDEWPKKPFSSVIQKH